MVEAAEDDRVVGVVWRYDSLVAGTFPIATPAAPESVSTGAAVAARYVHLDEVRGYRAVSGAWRVTKVDSTTLSGTVDGTLQRVGEADTVHFTASFERVPLTRDTTICRS
jgi:hypothetical protein